MSEHESRKSGGKVAVVVRCRPYLSKEVRDEGEPPFYMRPSENVVELTGSKDSSALVFGT
jgi:hypothetical protein